jgi:iron complex outermembrane receptor protein
MHPSSSSKSRYGVPAIVAAILAAANVGTVHANGASEADAAATAEADAGDIEGQQIIVTGTRQKRASPRPRARHPSRSSAGTRYGLPARPTLIDALAQLVPSFQAQAFGADMANQTLQARLRGLSPNHVLVLVDGKRRHTTASLAIDGGSRPIRAAPVWI